MAVERCLTTPHHPVISLHGSIDGLGGHMSHTVWGKEHPSPDNEGCITAEGNPERGPRMVPS